jgi:hypothetical protein
MSPHSLDLSRTSNYLRSALTSVLWLGFSVLALAQAQPAASAPATPPDEVIPASDYQPRYLKIPAGPQFVGQPAEADDGGEAFKSFTLDDVRQALDDARANQPEIRNRAKVFYVSDVKWLQSFVVWYGARLKDWNIHYQKEAFDCDDYATLMVLLANLMFVEKGDFSSVICIGRMTVKMAVAWGGIPAGDIHEMILVATNRGLMVIEPQNGKSCLLKDYPNREHIERLILP